MGNTKHIKKAVIIYLGYNKKFINGSMIDSFEYFYTLFEQDPNTYYVLLDYKHLKYFKDFLSTRYFNVNLDNVISVKTRDFILNKFYKVLITDSTTMEIFKTRIPIQSENIYCITEFNESKYIMKRAKYFSEMDDNRAPGDTYYYTKMRFDLLREPKHHKNVLYVNTPKEDPKLHIKEINKHLENRLKYISKTNSIYSNVFEEFDKYLYIKTKSWEDPRPRMFHECYYFDIPIVYINNLNKDGSYYRYQELLENGLKDRFLSKDDPLIQHILS